jgi:hypothetical protein
VTVAGRQPAAPDLERSALNRPTALLVPLLLFALLAVFLVWTVHDGGFAPEQWLPGGLLIVGLLAAALASPATRARLYRAPSAPLLLGLYVLWSYCSLAWAASPGDALDGANRTLIYWCAFVLAFLLPISERTRTILVATWAAAITAVGVVALVEAATAGERMGHFVLARLARPISYSDACAALFLMAAAALLVFAASRSRPMVVRAAAGGAAAVLADLALLCQSRGSLFALPVAVLLIAAISRSFLRHIAHAALVAAAVAPAIPTLLAVYPAVRNARGWHEAVVHAALWTGASGAIAVAATASAAAVDRRMQLSPRATRRANAAAIAAVLASVAIGAAVIAPRLPERWHQFTHEPPQTRSHFEAGLNTSRYDVWRVAIDQFRAHPLTGVGADNFLIGYLRHRHTHQTSRYPSSTELRLFSETGLIGALLFLGFLAVAGRRAVAAARKTAAPAALAAVAVVVYWLVHSSIDWFWEIPALTAPALALLGLAAGAVELSPRREWEHPIVLRLGLVAVATLAVVAALAVLAIPWIAVRQTNEAVALGAGPRAYELFSSAASLNPLSEQPALAEAAVAARAGALDRERRALHAALRRNRSDWYPHFMLGIVAGVQHRIPAARRQLAEAHRLSPRDLIVTYAQQLLEIGRPMTQHGVAELYRDIEAGATGARQR